MPLTTVTLRSTMPSSALLDSDRGVVADASAVINLVASGAAREVAQVLPAPLRVVRAVALELESGRPRWTTSDHLTDLVSAGVVEIVDLDDAASEHFEALVVGPAAATLDDGEAATIAYALTNGLAALIDERKAWRICRERFGTLTVTTTVDLLLSAGTEQALGISGVAEALFNALSAGRMRVPAVHLERVIEIVGTERAALCNSLPIHVRIPSEKRAV